MKPQCPFQIWNEAVDMTGFGSRASSNEGAAILKRLKAELGGKFEQAFRMRMVTSRADSLEQLLQDWLNERTRLGV